MAVFWGEGLVERMGVFSIKRGTSEGLRMAVIWPVKKDQMVCGVVTAHTKLIAGVLPVSRR